MVKSSCARVTRRSASVIWVGVYSVRLSRRLKEELSWNIDKRLRLITNIVVFKTVVAVGI